MNQTVMLSGAAARSETYPYRYAQISIIDPGGQLGVLAWPLSADPHRVALLRCEFYDARGSAADPWGRDDVPEKWKLPTVEQVAPVVPFVLEWKNKVDGFVVNCAAGISRSAGVAAGIARLIGVDDAPAYAPPHDPNPLVRNIILAEIARLT